MKGRDESFTSVVCNGRVGLKCARGMDPAGL